MYDLLAPPLWDLGTQQPLVGMRVDPAHELAEGLVGYWACGDGAGGQVTDFSGNDLHGTLTLMDPATDWVGSPYGGALDFDSANDYVAIPASPALNITGDLSVLARVYIRTMSTNHHIFAHYNTSNPYPGYALDVGLSGGLRFWDGSSWRLSATGYLSTNTWREVAAVHTGAVVQFYVDGQAAGSPVAASSLSSFAGTAAIGGTNIGGNLFDGRIADVTVYARALTASEIAEYFDAGLVRPRPRRWGGAGDVREYPTTYRVYPDASGGTTWNVQPT